MRGGAKMKKLLWAGILASIVGFIVWSNDPLNDTVNFIIAGSIPRTDISIGFWSTILLALLLLWGVFKALKSLRMTMFEQYADQSTSSAAKKAFEDANKIEFDKSQRSVIAARNPDSI